MGAEAFSRSVLMGQSDAAERRVMSRNLLCGMEEIVHAAREVVANLLQGSLS